MKSIECPVCGGKLLKGFYLRDAGSKAYEQKLFSLKSVFLFQKSFYMRARVCASCGHIDLYVHPDDLQELIEFKQKSAKKRGGIK